MKMSIFSKLITVFNMVAISIQTYKGFEGKNKQTESKILMET